MHVVLCLLVVVNCVGAKIKENEFERATIRSKDEVTGVTSTSLPTAERTRMGTVTPEDYISKTTNISSNLLSDLDGTDTSQSISYSNFFTSSPYTTTEFEATTKATCDEIPEIDNLTVIELNSFNVSLQWDPPKNSHCVEKYVVYLNNTRLNTTDTELFVLLDLNACEVHKVGIAVFNGNNEGKRKSINFTTPTPRPFRYSVGSLEVKEYTKNLKVTWQKPSIKVLQCVIGYNVTWKHNGVTNSNKTTDRYINIPNVPCAQYEILVYPQIDQKTIGLPKSQNYTTNSPLPKIDNFTIAKVGSFKVFLQWNPPTNTNCFKTYVVYLNRKQYQQTNYTELSVKNLDACQLYEIGIGVSNGTHMGKIHSKWVTTLAPNPFSYSVRNIEVKELDGNLKVTWQPPPDNVLQCVTSYYFQWENEEDFQNVTIAANTKQIFQLPKISCLQYEFFVYPQTDNLEGLPLHLTYTTKEYPTNRPKLVENTIEKTEALTIWEIDDTSNKCPQLKLVVTCDTPDDFNNNSSWIIREKTAILDINSTDVTMPIDELSPFTNYTCLAVVTNTAGNSSAVKFEFSTKADVPSIPRKVEVTNIDLYSFLIMWSKPEKIPGMLTGYHVEVRQKRPAFDPPLWDCEYMSTIVVNETINASQNSYNFIEALPYYKYNISVFAINIAGNGDVVTTEHTSNASNPGPVTNLELHKESEHPEKIVVRFTPPCNLNGPFRDYEICILEEADDGVKTCNRTLQTSEELYLKPEHNYTIVVRTFNKYFASIPTTKEIQTDPGVPILGVTLQPPSSNETTKSYFKFSKDAFDDSNGKILHYALKLSPKKSTSDISSGLSGLWDHTWPSDSITPANWNPFKNGANETIFIIGENETCTKLYCNMPLDEDTEYTLIVRGFTRKTYRDIAPLHFKTLKPSKTGLILGLVFGFVILLVVPVGLFLWKRANTLHSTDDKASPTSPTTISCAKFSSFYEHISENPNILKTQFATLGSQSKEVALATSYGVLPENKRKNRYTNILPYDHTRVKLQIDEDDEISSDYINASYIKGYSGRIEYIATQGPLESTSKDFWKMIVQENVTMIVMVSQFVEQSKEKCFQYFPNNHEKVSFGESLDVRCSTELHFGTYCIRTLQVRKDTEQRNVIHMQYLEWPDFGVPQCTDNVLQLCHQMREKASTEGGLIVVHCSAGVGRTGTLIALDILLQTIERQKNLNIFKTVFELRKQRINMVQTEKQYVFLHTCVRDYLQSPTIHRSKDQLLDHTYENMDILRSSLTKNLLEIESESTL